MNGVGMSSGSSKRCWGEAPERPDNSSKGTDDGRAKTMLRLRSRRLVRRSLYRLHVQAADLVGVVGAVILR